MSEIIVSAKEMNHRCAKFRDLTPSKEAFVDTRIPEHQRTIFNVLKNCRSGRTSVRKALSAQ